MRHIFKSMAFIFVVFFIFTSQAHALLFEEVVSDALHPRIKIKSKLSLEIEAPGLAEGEDIPLLMEKAEKGDLESQMLMGWMQFVSGDREKGKKLLKAAAEKGHAGSQFFYGISFIHDDEPGDGRSWTVSEESARNIRFWMEKSADQDYAQAILYLAKEERFYLDHQSDRTGFRHAEDLERSVSILRKAALLGDAQSAQALGKLYYEGEKLVHDGVAAYAWLYLSLHGYTEPAKESEEEGMERSDDEATQGSRLDFLAWTLTLDEIHQVEKALADWPKSPPPAACVKIPSMARTMEDLHTRQFATLIPPGDLDNLKAKAEAGNGDAQLELATWYCSGKAVERDMKQCEQLLKRAAEGGNEKALYFHAMNSCSDGEADCKRKTSERFAAKGNKDAQSRLGRMLVFNRDTKIKEEIREADTKKGIGWLEKAANQGDIGSMLALARYHKDIDEDKEAAAWYERAAILGNEDAMLELVGLAESAGNDRDLYQWVSICMSMQAPENRRHLRELLAMFAVEHTDKEVQHLRSDVDKWLKKNPEILKIGKERTAAAMADMGRDKFGRTPLHFAVLANDTAKTQRLIASGMDVNSLDYEGQTPLHLAAGVKSRNMSSFDYEDETLLHAADGAKGMDAAKLLIAAGAIINAQNPAGETPLACAVFQNNDEAVKFFLAQNANPNIGNNEGQTPLHLAAEKGNIKIAQELLTAKARPDLPDHYGKTALDLAADEEISRLMTRHK